jgi:hypothetical protein
MIPSRSRALGVALVALVGFSLTIAGCAGPMAPTPPASASSAPGGSPGGSTPASPAASGGGSGGTVTVDTAEAAAAAALATDPRFAGIGPLDPNVIGACCSWSSVATNDGWTVTIEVGWGDCPAGCIDRHHWVYAVARDGTVTLVREDGPPLPAGVPPLGGDQTGLVGIRGVASAGPVCPVERPNDPNCVPRPVVGATVHVLDESGTEVAQLQTDPTGAFSVTLPPGRYQVRADPVEGLMTAPPPVEIQVTNGLAPVELAYDTGIR